MGACLEMATEALNPNTWPTQAKIRRQLEIEASDAEWEGDEARAALLRARLTGLDPKLDHELVVPF